MQEIGDKYGVTRERIRQVLKYQVRCRRHTTDMEKIVYEGLYNYMMDNPKLTFPNLARLMFGTSNGNYAKLVRNFLNGRNCRIRKRAYDRLMAATGMTYEELFKLREGFKEEANDQA